MPFHKLILTLAATFGLYIASVIAQTGNPSPAGIKGLAMGDIRTIVQGPEAVFSNPSMLGWADHSSFSAFAQNRYFAQGLNGYFAGGILHGQNGSFGLDAYTYGWGAYNEGSLGLQYGRKLAENLSLGLKLKAYHFSISEYGQRTVIGADLAAFQRITRRFAASVVISNPIPVELSEAQDIPSAIHLGFSFEFSEKLNAVFELSKVEKLDVVAKFGVNYKPSEAIDLMLGYQSLENQLSFGTNFHVRSLLDIGLTASMHPLLGTSLAGGINYHFTQRS